MQQFIDRYRGEIEAVLSGFDRLVLRGSLRRLNYSVWDAGLQAMVARGMEEYLWQNQILFKDYAGHVKQISERLKSESLQPLRERNLPVVFLRAASADKEAMARRIAEEKGIGQGPVCAISTLESSPTFEHRGTHIVRRERPCHVLYHYQIHPEVGWMYARIQSWFPFNIQVGLNGREWLARQMDRQGMKYRQQGNCFVWIEDWERAQVLLAEQVRTNWSQWLDAQAGQLNPIRESVFMRYPVNYYWTCHQSEWATDVVFRKAEFLRRLMPLLVRHGVLSYSSSDVMRWFGGKVNQTGEIPARFAGSLETDLKGRQEGERVKYRRKANSIKFYDKAYSAIGSVLRGAETTINRGEDFRVYRPREGGPEADLQWRPLRRGIADIYRRTEVSQQANERLLNALAHVDDSTRVDELTAAMQEPVRWNGRRHRALRPWGDDRSLLAAINHGDFLINGLRNRDLQRLFYGDEAPNAAERQKRSAAISRKLRLLRAHGLIRKVPRTHRYQVTDAARPILIAVLATAQTSVYQLNQMAKAA